MLFTSNLEDIIIHRHGLFQTDELIVISGYIGPKPIQRLQDLPFPSKVVYGMYASEGIKRSLHNSILVLQTNIKKLNIYYSKFPVHSKCYVWRKNGEIVHALVGSANFSTNGLNTPNREILAETSYDTFNPLNDYVKMVLNNSMSCLEMDSSEVIEEIMSAENTCLLTLLGRNGEVQNAAGINWGQNPANHTTLNDAYIKISVQDIRKFPDLFPPKQLKPTVLDARGRSHRHNDAIEIIWDDGTNMEGLLMGSQYIDNIKYPKQITSFPKGNELGIYLRKRLNVILPPKSIHKVKQLFQLILSFRLWRIFLQILLVINILKKNEVFFCYN